MNKKSFSYIVITVLCLNLLPQTSNAFTLNKTRDDVIYNDELEKDNWDTYYLIYARHLKFINKTGTMLDIAKKAEKDPYLIPEIMDRTHYERGKAIVKWERDNGCIAELAEEIYQITPQIRRKMLAEIEEEEEKENKERSQSWWKRFKSDLKVSSAGIAFIGAIATKTEPIKAVNIIALVVTTVSAAADVIEAGGGWIWNKTIGRLWKNDNDEEIELPPLSNKMMPDIPKGHKKIDLHSL